MALRHFPYRHPTFGTKHKPKTSSHWKVSVYYWWFEYLRRNPEYPKTAKEPRNRNISKLYADFGDIHTQDFKAWWTTDNRGASLFAEPPIPAIRVLTTEIVEDQGFPEEGNIVLEVPLGLPITFLVRNFRKIVSARHSGKRGIRHSISSNARYKVTGKVDVAFLETALMVWDVKQADPKKPLWKIAQDLGIGGANRLQVGDPPAVIVDKKNVLAATASRYYRKAFAMIRLTSEGRFPH